MRRNLIITLFLTLVLVMFVGCGKDQTDTEEVTPVEDTEEMVQEPQTPGAFENDLIRVSLKEGWEVFDDNLDQGLMRIRNVGDTGGTGPAIYFVFHGEIAGKSPCGTDPKEAVTKFAEEYNGSEVEEVVFNDVVYYKTVFDYEGPQVMMQTKLDGSCIHVKLAGEGAVENPDIQEMLATVSYKLPAPEEEITEEQMDAEEETAEE